MIGAMHTSAADPRAEALLGGSPLQRQGFRFLALLLARPDRGVSDLARAETARALPPPAKDGAVVAPPPPVVSRQTVYRALEAARAAGYDVEVTAAISRGSRHPRGPNGPRCPCPVIKHRRLHAPPCRKASPVATLAPAGAA